MNSRLNYRFLQILTLSLVLGGLNARLCAGEIIASHEGQSHPVTDEGWAASSGTYAYFGSATADAWRIDDNSTAGSLYYSKSLTSDQISQIAVTGWTLSVKIKVTDIGNAPNQTRYVDFEDTLNNVRWGIDFGSDAEGNLQYSLRGTGVFEALGGAGYHTFSLVYDPNLQSASLLVEGAVVSTGYQGFSSTSSPATDRIRWGSTSGPNLGAADYALVTFSTGMIPEPSAWGASIGGVLVLLVILGAYRRRGRHSR